MYWLAPDVTSRSTEAGHFLVARRPLRAVRVNRALLAVVERCRRGPVKAASAAELRALDALARGGFLERKRPLHVPADRLPAVSVVIPVRDRARELERCLRSLQNLRYPAGRLEIVVVDDGSRDDSTEVARAHGAVVVDSGGSGWGPAAARNRGVAAAKGEILAFVDSDCTVSPGWLEELAGEFDDPDVDAVGGRVEGLHVATALDRYEAQMSSLSLGKRERSGQGGDDTFYLPSCNLLVRRAALLRAGGFREGMHVGEDVDLTWRLRDRGGKIAYVPRGWVWHEHRNRLAAFVRRRFAYGTSEAMLHALHPRRRKKMALPPILTVVFALLMLGAVAGGWAWVGVAAGLFGVDVLRVWRRFAGRGLELPALQVAGARARVLGSLAYYLGGHAFRYYGVPILLVGAAWPEFGLVALALLLAVGFVVYNIRKPSLPLPRFFFFYLAEELSYGAGVFWGCWRQKAFSSYRTTICRRMQTNYG
jgi:mycofactocin system glycosyltransferase